MSAELALTFGLVTIGYMVFQVSQKIREENEEWDKFSLAVAWLFEILVLYAGAGVASSAGLSKFENAYQIGFWISVVIYAVFILYIGAEIYNKEEDEVLSGW